MRDSITLGWLAFADVVLSAKGSVKSDCVKAMDGDR